MSTKPFKDIEQMMKAAAEGYEQPFDEAAWVKMEVLLDGDKGRRRPIFWLWWLLPLFIGAGIGGYFIFNKADQPGGSIIVPGSKSNNVKANPSSNRNATSLGKVYQSPVNASVAEPAIQGPPPSLNINNGTALHVKTRVLRVDDQLNKDNPTATGRERSYIEGKARARVQVNNGETLPVADSDKQPGTDNDKTSSVIIEQAAPVNVDPSADSKKPELTKAVPPANDTLPPAEKKDARKVKATDKNSRWYFVLAGGAEGSSPRVFAVDKISARGGAVIGYQLNRNFSLQTGFFAGSKKYVAGPKDYKAKAGTYWSMVDLVEVDANCLVFEIPLNIRYDLRPGKATNVFTTAGLSSYIMKKEDYEYSYNHYGYPRYGQAGYKGNKHLLSVLRLSVGIERKFSQNLSLFAAPALSVPLAGVGEGQVKLYSAEIMVGLKYQPVKKSKHK